MHQIKLSNGGYGTLPRNFVYPDAENQGEDHCPEWYKDLDKKIKDSVKELISVAKRCTEDLIQNIMDETQQNHREVENLLNWWFHDAEVEENNITLTFEPGDLGFSHSLHGKVTNIQPHSQADKLGIQVGWEILEIDQLPWNIGILKEKKNGKKNYPITFMETVYMLKDRKFTEDISDPFELNSTDRFDEDPFSDSIEKRGPGKVNQEDEYLNFSI